MREADSCFSEESQSTAIGDADENIRRRHHNFLLVTALYNEELLGEALAPGHRSGPAYDAAGALANRVAEASGYVICEAGAMCWTHTRRSAGDWY
jgi:hypothetical protein